MLMFTKPQNGIHVSALIKNNKEWIHEKSKHNRPYGQHAIRDKEKDIKNDYY